MKQTRILMGMPITLEVVDSDDGASIEKLIDDVFAYFAYADEKFSTYKEHSEISMINRREITLEEASADMKAVFSLADEIRLATDGYFNIQREKGYDPSGLVKGWAISNAAELVRQKGYENFYIEAGGDIQAEGRNSQGQNWRVGIRNPFHRDEIVKVLSIHNCGVATSGTYIRGQHIYNPKNGSTTIPDVISLTVIGPDIYEADCFVTAAFAIGREGIGFIENLEGFEGYLIDQNQMATYTSNFMRYVSHDEMG